jgi:hypothetical protein
MKTITIRDFCLCVRGKRDNFVKGQRYFVTKLYQHRDGALMVEVDNSWGARIQALANRFLVI